MTDTKDPARTGLEVDPTRKRTVLWLYGRGYEVPALVREDFGAARKHLASLRLPALEALKAQFDALADHPALQAAFLEKAWQDFRLPSEMDVVPAEQVARWLDTLEGLAWSYWHLLERRYPGQLSREDVASVLMHEAEEQARRLGVPVEEAALRTAGAGRDVAAAPLVERLGVGGQPGNGTPPARSPAPPGAWSPPGKGG